MLGTPETLSGGTDIPRFRENVRQLRGASSRMHRGGCAA